VKVQIDTASRGHPAPGRRRIETADPVVRRAARRISWGVADQGMSSISNFAVNIYIARTLGATDYGAFSLAYVTYSFILNASRGLATDPLLVRFSGTRISIWRRAVANCTGTAAATGLVAGACVVLAAMAMHGVTRLAFLALGIALPALLLQDSWRFAFFALGRGRSAFVNDTIWAVALVPALVLLRTTRHTDVFWALLAWGAAAAVAAAVGPVQAGVMPRLSGVRLWLSSHRDLGPRYLAEGTANSGSTQLRNYGIGLLLGLAAVGYVQAASTLMGPFMVVFLGMGLVTLPEAARILRRSPRYMPLFCVFVSCGLALMGLTWGIVLLLVLPRGLGHLLLGNIWRPTYPLVLPSTVSILGGCVSAGAGAGLHALGAARRSLRAMVVASVAYVIFGVLGAALLGPPGAIEGTAIAAWIGAFLFWWELRSALRDSHDLPLLSVRATGRHRKSPVLESGRAPEPSAHTRAKTTHLTGSSHAGRHPQSRPAQG
jgi:O-antigen/teichoic acid export membrane protein